MYIYGAMGKILRHTDIVIMTKRDQLVIDVLRAVENKSNHVECA